MVGQSLKRSGETSVKPDNETSEPRYSPAKAAVVALVRPVTAVRRADHLSLGWAWAVHVAGLGALIIAALLLAAWSEAPPDLTIDTYKQVVLGLLIRGAGQLEDYRSIAGQVLSILLIEGTFCLSAMLAMSWCARDEKIRNSYRRALRRLFLLTPHAATVVAVTGATAVWCNRLNRVPWQPVIVHESREMALFLMITASCLWTLTVVLAALGCRKAPAMCRWPARCEGCGYQLTGLAIDKDCPECGDAIRKTLGKSIRPGIAPPPGVGIVWWLCLTYQAVRHPSVFGKKLHVLSPDTGHRECLAITIVLLMLASPIAMGVLYVGLETVRGMKYASWQYRGDEIISATIMGGSMMGLMLTATMVAIALAGASMIGLIEGRRHGRNLMPAAVRAACYQSGFVLFGVFVFWLDLAVFLIVMELDLLTPIATRYNIDSELLVIAWQLGVIGLGIVIYLWLIGRATYAARNANW